MVPRIARRGHSFKGAGAYYLHDKQASSNERVLWTHTVNLPTKDPEKAFRWMAHTSMNAGRLKKQAGIPSTGRKSKAGEVYSFSLAWHPEQNPDQKTMLQSALDTLNLLGLHEHEAVIIAHSDRPHPHAHVICNLVNPENGKTAVVSYDRLTLSQWAENVERNDGKILCEQRVINNQKRRERGAEGMKKLTLVKHRESRLDRAQEIQALYDQSDSSAAFKAALQDKGYTLAQGDQRGLVLVDEAGKIYSLSRQLKAQRAADMKARLSGFKNLPLAVDLAAQRQQAGKETTNKAGNDSGEHLRRLDELRDWEQKSEREKHRLKQQQEELYRRGDLLKSIWELQDQLAAKETLMDKLTGKRGQLEERLAALNANLETVDKRMAEQLSALEAEQLKTKPGYSEQREDERRAKEQDYEQRMQKYRNAKRDRDGDNDLGR
ncbi:MAG: relaxase/mobilization nuclease domain-containing protein [Bacteroidetes bacterium]|nr:MAG: relaxase/mobilization nuclease domain-containing protein [Bacteroidota bacterium]